MMLIAMSGLPGSGKTTIAHALAKELSCPVLSVDTIDVGMRNAGIDEDQPRGLAAYAVAQALADVQLRLGMSVIADAVNVATPARQAWIDLAAAHQVPLVVVDVQCSVPAAHRARVAARPVELREITCEDVQQKGKEATPWPVATHQVDSAQPVERVVAHILDQLGDS